MTDITVLQMPLFNRAYKKLQRNQQEVTDQAVAAIVKNPALGTLKKGDLSGVYQQFLLAYEWEPTTRTLLALGVHENFYRDLKRGRN